MAFSAPSSWTVEEGSLARRPRPPASEISLAPRFAESSLVRFGACSSMVLCT